MIDFNCLVMTTQPRRRPLPRARLKAAATLAAKAALVLAVLAGLCLPAPLPCRAADYERYMAADGDEFYYDKGSIGRDASGKMVYTSLIRFSEANALAQARKFRYAVPCATTLQVIHLDCTMNMFAIVQVADFDAQGNLLGQPHVYQGMWKAILQGSPADKMKAIICK